MPVFVEVNHEFSVNLEQIAHIAIPDPSKPQNITINFCGAPPLKLEGNAMKEILNALRAK